MEHGIIWLHVAVALLAGALGIANLAARKGTPRHRVVGRAWIGLMAATAISSFWIQELNPGSYSWIHGLSIWTLALLPLAVLAIRHGRVRTHRNIVIGLMAGLLIAGAFAMAPGRFMGRMLGYG